MGVRTRIPWLCEICKEPVKDGTGYISLPDRELRRYEMMKSEWPEPPPGSFKVWSLAELRAHPDSNPAHWWTIHRTCDPEPEAGGYWFDIERCRTSGQLLRWTAHLMEKDWLGSTDWNVLIERAVGLLGVPQL